MIGLSRSSHREHHRRPERGHLRGIHRSRYRTRSRTFQWPGRDRRNRYRSIGSKWWRQRLRRSAGSLHRKVARTAKTNAAGQFSLSALPAGDYEVQVSSCAGFKTACAEIHGSAARPRSALGDSGIGASSTVVEVTAANVVSMEWPPMPGSGMVACGRWRGRRGHRWRAWRRARASGPPHERSKLYATRSGRQEGRQTAQPSPRKGPLRPPRTCAPTFPRRSTSIRKSSLTQSGAASITIPIADSITTWRMAMLASTTHGALGSATSSLKVFQDFFVDLDLPVTLTQGDRVSIPVAVYNYSGARGDVSLKLQRGRLVFAGR